MTPNDAFLLCELVVDVVCHHNHVETLTYAIGQRIGCQTVLYRLASFRLHSKMLPMTRLGIETRCFYVWRRKTGARAATFAFTLDAQHTRARGRSRPRSPREFPQAHAWVNDVLLPSGLSCVGWSQGILASASQQLSG